MRARGSSRQPKDRSPRLRLPVRSAEPDESGHEVDAVIGVERARESLTLCGVVENAESVAKPLDRRARDEDGGFQRVCRPTPRIAGDGRKQSLSRAWYFVARIEQQKRTRAVRILCLARAAASLPE